MTKVPRIMLAMTIIVALVAFVAAGEPAQQPGSQPVTTSWRVEFDGSRSAPVIVDGVLYVGSADGAVIALDPKTGETRWRFQTGESLPPATAGAPIVTVPRGTSFGDQVVAGMTAAEKQEREGVRRVDMTPLVENGKVFIGAGDHVFYAIDAATGKKKWSYDAGSSIASSVASSNVASYSGSAAVLEEGTTYFVTDNGLHALDALTGTRKWLFETLQEIPLKEMNRGRKRAPAGPVLGDGVLFLTAWPYVRSEASEKCFLYAVDPESGNAKWVTSVAGLDITAPAIAKGQVLFATKEPAPLGSFSHRATLYAINVVDGQIKWKFGTSIGYGTSDVLIADNTTYFRTDKSLCALEPESGRQLWSFTADDIGPGLWADNARLYVVTHKGSLMRPEDTLHALTLATGQEQWSQGPSGSARVAMIQDGVVYAGGDRLHALDAGTGKELWSFKGTGRELARLISGGRIFLTSPTGAYVGTTRVDQGYLYAIDAKTGRFAPSK